jgi:hypothetical protein
MIMLQLASLLLVVIGAACIAMPARMALIGTAYSRWIRKKTGFGKTNEIVTQAEEQRWGQKVLRPAGILAVIAGIAGMLNSLGRGAG